MSVTITKRRYPEIHRALCALLGEHKQFKTIDHFETWLPKAERGLKALRRDDEDEWRVFVVGGNGLGDVIDVRDHRKPTLNGAHQFLDYMAN